MKKLFLVLFVSIVFFSCSEVQTGGCTDILAYNYESFADFDDGTCIYEGCFDPEADNFDPLADIETENYCQYSKNVVYYLEYSAAQYMLDWGISYYAFYDNINSYMGYITSDFYWTSPPNCLPQADGSTLTTTIVWNGNLGSNTASFTWDAYPDDGPIADYSSTIIVEPGGCLQLALTANGIKDYKNLID